MALSHEQHWLLVRGTGDDPLPARVRPDMLRGHSSTRRPAVQRGDVAICYASVWQALFAVVEVVSDPEQVDAGAARWSWSFSIRPLIALDDLDRAPPVEAAGIFPQSIWRHSYIRLTRGQFDAARELIARAAG